MELPAFQGPSLKRAFHFFLVPSGGVNSSDYKSNCEV